MLSLRTDAGEYVPVLFRPFHEHTGNGFWWGKGNCTAEEYIALWRFTLEYLRDTKGVHNLLYVYSPDIVSSQDNYLEFWPAMPMSTYSVWMPMTAVPGPSRPTACD